MLELNHFKYFSGSHVIIFIRLDPCKTKTCGEHALCGYDGVGNAVCSCPLEGDDEDPEVHCSKLLKIKPRIFFSSKFEFVYVILSNVVDIHI